LLANWFCKVNLAYLEKGKFMENKKIALFIDAENISPQYAKLIFDTASNYGEILIKRIYADWTNTHLKKWKNVVGEYSIQAIQCFAFSSYKNSSDMYLITDVLEVLYEKKIDIFIIASSDSDYTSLIQKLRENDKQTLGFGKRQSLKSYVNSFNEFVYLDAKFGKELEKELKKDLILVIESLIETKGRAEYAQINMDIKRKYSDFIPKNYDCPNFRTLIREKFLSKINKYKESNEKNIFYLINKD